MQLARRGVECSVRGLRWPYRVVTVESACRPVTHTTAHPDLREHGIELRSYADGPAALLGLIGEDPAAVLAPTDLVGIDFLRFVSAIVAWSDVPVIIGLTDDPDSATQAYRALEIGARGLLGLPLAPVQLASCLRHFGYTNTTPTGLQYGVLSLDRHSHEARLAGIPVRLTLREFTLLDYLLAEAPRIVSLTEIGTILGEPDAPADPARVRKGIQVLRRKLARIQPDQEPLIESVRGLGYRLINTSADSA